jgi:hypothetical protein
MSLRSSRSRVKEPIPRGRHARQLKNYQANCAGAGLSNNCREGNLRGPNGWEVSKPNRTLFIVFHFPPRGCLCSLNDSCPKFISHISPTRLSYIFMSHPDVLIKAPHQKRGKKAERRSKEARRRESFSSASLLV